MELIERITIVPRSLEDRAPLSSEDISRLMKATLLGFKSSGRRVEVQQPFKGLHIEEAVRSYVETELPHYKVTHSIVPIFDESDYQRAPLWKLLFPEIWIDGLNFLTNCKMCGRASTRIDQFERVHSVPADDQKLATVNGQFTIVREDATNIIRAELTGARLVPFDDSGTFFYLLSHNTLKPLITLEGEVKNLRADCQECKRPQFDMRFGPLRFPHISWSGDDIVSECFHRSNAYTPKAADLLLGIQPSVTRGGVVLLD